MSAAHPAIELSAAHALPDFQRLLGSRWWRLNAATRRRFASHDPARYNGAMDVHCSAFGRALATFCHLIGTPLVPVRGRDVPTHVIVTPTPQGRGMMWARHYRFANRTVVCRSVKTWHEEHGLLECISGSLGMMLAVRVHAGTLHFVSRYYFVCIAGRHLRLPRWLGPGRTHVTHQDVGGGRFRFGLRIRHHWFGDTFRQSGIFRDVGARDVGANPATNPAPRRQI